MTGKRCTIWPRVTSEYEKIIARLTFEEETVLDPMMGTGTAGIAQLKTGPQVHWDRDKPSKIHDCEVRANSYG